MVRGSSEPGRYSPITMRKWPLPKTIVTNRDMLTDTLLSTEGTPHYPGMTHRHQLADTVVNGFSADPLQALQSESLITTGDPLSGIAAVRPSAPLSASRAK